MQFAERSQRQNFEVEVSAEIHRLCSSEGLTMTTPAALRAPELHSSCSLVQFLFPRRLDQTSKNPGILFL